MSGYERVRWAVYYRRSDGEVRVVDVFRARLEKMRKRISAWAEVVQIWRKDNPSTLIMVTLTYRRVDGYDAGHIRTYINRVRGMLKDRLIAWAWVAELQKRGAVHYHLMMVVKKGTRIPMPDKHGHWEHGMSEVQRARTPYYLLKYVGKEHQKDFARYPKGCRTYAVSIGMGKDWKNMYRNLAGLPNKKGKNQAWGHLGSCVTEGYARHILAERVMR
jgi:hypothetical protein